MGKKMTGEGRHRKPYRQAMARFLSTVASIQNVRGLYFPWTPFHDRWTHPWVRAMDGILPLNLGSRAFRQKSAGEPFCPPADRHDDRTLIGRHGGLPQGIRRGRFVPALQFADSGHPGLVRHQRLPER